MKTNVFKQKLFTAVLFASIIFFGCDKNNDNPGSSKSTITDVVSADADLSTLKSAVVKANLATTLSGAGPFTLFAPTNDAFTSAGIDANALNAMSTDQLTSVLLYHVIPSKITSTDVPAGPNAKVVTASGDTVFVTKNANGVFINGAQVTKADIAASNGVIHKINAVLMPPTGNIVETAQADTAFSFLVAAVLRASTGSTNVAAALTGSAPLTVFAPTNNAFRAAGFANVAAVDAADPNTLAGILTYHVVAGRVFSSDLTDGAQPTTLNGGKLTISLSSGVTVKGNSNTTASKVTKANIVATNGVIHVIDQVLLP